MDAPRRRQVAGVGVDLDGITPSRPGRAGSGVVHRGSQPGDRNGAWYSPETTECLHPDTDHPTDKDIGPHWDYTPGKGKDPVRINPNTGEPLQPGEMPEKPPEPKEGSDGRPESKGQDGVNEFRLPQVNPFGMPRGNRSIEAPRPEKLLPVWLMILFMALLLPLGV